MPKINVVFFFFIFFSMVKFGNSQEILVIKNKPMKIKSIELEHTNPSLGPYEEPITITLINSEEHIEKIHTFIKKSQVNSTITLIDFIRAKINNDYQLLEKVYKNAPKTNLNDGESISNLTINTEEGKEIVLEDVYRKYNLTNFYPDFTSYMVENGSTSSFNSFTAINDEPIVSSRVIELDMMDLFYTTMDLIIEFSIMSGSPGVGYYHLKIFGDGRVDFHSVLGKYEEDTNSNKKIKSNISPEEIESILLKAKEIDFKNIIKTLDHPPSDDGSQRVFSIRQDGYLKTATFDSDIPLNNDLKGLSHHILDIIEEEEETKHSFSDEDLIIELRLTPGMPNSCSYQLLVYGDGNYTFKGSSKESRHNRPISLKDKNEPKETSLTPREINTILKKAEGINFTEEDSLSLPKAIQHVDDGQQTIFSIWKGEGLRKEVFGHGNYMDKETKALADYILSLVEW